jgi:hypothetical protein
MSTWRFGDFEVHSDGSCNSQLLQDQLQKGQAFYSYGRAPDGVWPVDLDDDWTIDQWVHQKAKLLKLNVETDYEGSEPPKKVIAFAKARVRIDPNATY